MVVEYLSRQSCPSRVIESKDSGNKKLPHLDFMINTTANKFFRETDLILHRGNTFTRSRVPIRIKIEGKKERVFYVSTKKLIDTCANLWGGSAVEVTRHFSRAVKSIRKKTVTVWSSKQIDRLTNLTYRFLLAAMNNANERREREAASSRSSRSSLSKSSISSRMSPVEMQVSAIENLGLFDDLALPKKVQKRVVKASYDGDEDSMTMIRKHLADTRDRLSQSGALPLPAQGEPVAHEFKPISPAEKAH